MNPAEKKRRRGCATVQDLRARCRIDAATHCWHWLGATTARDGAPRVYAFDHQRVEKRSMSGPLAAWNIAHGAAPRAGHLVFRCCGTADCLNPAHLGQARDKAEIGLHVRRAGWRKGTALESRRANLAKAHAAAGCIPTPAAIVLAIRAAPSRRDGGPTSKALAEQYGISLQTVSRIRRGESHRHLLPVPEAA